MFTPNFETFKQLAGESNLVPIYREQIADMETPVSALCRLDEEENLFLLESVEGAENWGRYSFIGLNPHSIFTIQDNVARVQTAAGVEELHGPERPLFKLRSLLKERRVAKVAGLPRFVAGAAGYMGYETVNEFEKLPEPKKKAGTPTTCMMLTDEMLVFDNVRKTLKVVACARIDEHDSLEAAYGDACRRIEKLETRLHRPVSQDIFADISADAPEMSSNLTCDQYGSMVRRAKEYITDGDIIQVVLSQKFQSPLMSSPLTIYRALRLINPSPYTFFLKFGDHQLVGSSPEVMVRLTDGLAELRPIAGTRPRGKTEPEDRQLAEDLLADKKECAEHLMLVDLGRNDLGRVACPGSVEVQDFMTIERYSHVMHIVSHVKANLLPGHDAFDLIKATFPAGTLSGAPKIRAMEIIHELEPEPRGTYGGAVGYIGYDGNMDLAITIRTLDIHDSTVSLQAGAGIVFDSDPQKEYEETCHKARGMMQALNLASRNLDLTTLPK